MDPQLLRELAAEGRTVLVSSHLMSEMALTADHLVIIGRGRLIADVDVREFVRHSSGVLVRADDQELLTGRLTRAGASVEPGPESALVVTGLEAGEIGRVALEAGVALSELTPQRLSLEEAYMNLTRDSLEYQAVVA